MRKLFQAYRILAMIVGVLLTLLAVGMVMKYGLPDGTRAQEVGDTLTGVVAVAHGWIYIIYVGVAFGLATKAQWSLKYLGQMLLAGIVPIVIFFVERRVRLRLLAEHPELAR